MAKVITSVANVDTTTTSTGWRVYYSNDGVAGSGTFTIRLTINNVVIGSQTITSTSTTSPSYVYDSAFTFASSTSSRTALLSITGTTGNITYTSALITFTIPAAAAANYPRSPSVSSVSATSLTASWAWYNSAAHTGTVYLYIDGSRYTYASMSYPTTSYAFSFSSATYARTAYITVVSNDGGYSASSSSVTIPASANGGTASISITNIAQTSATVQLTGLDTNYQASRTWALTLYQTTSSDLPYYSTGNAYYASGTLSAGVSSGAVANVTGLNPGTTYYCRYYVTGTSLEVWIPGPASTSTVSFTTSAATVTYRTISGVTVSNMTATGCTVRLTWSSGTGYRGWINIYVNQILIGYVVFNAADSAIQDYAVTWSSSTSARSAYVGVNPSSGADSYATDTKFGPYTIPAVTTYCVPSSGTAANITATGADITVYWSSGDNYSASIGIYDASGNNIVSRSTTSAAGSSYSFTASWSGTTASRTFYLRCTNQAGNLVSLTSFTVPAQAVRPSDWTWTAAHNSGYAWASGAAVKLLATAWNSFTAQVNAFRAYKGLSAYSFTAVSSGTTFSAAIFNQAVTAINACSPSTTAASVTAGQAMSIAAFNNLSTALNSIT